MRLFLYFIFFFSSIISSTPSYSIDELSNYREKCKTLGFSENTESFGNCVLKLLDEIPSLKIKFEKIYGEKNKVFHDTSENCERAKIVRGKKVYLWLYFNDEGNCPVQSKLFSGYVEWEDSVATYRSKISNGVMETHWAYANGRLSSKDEFNDGLRTKSISYMSSKDDNKIDTIWRFKDGIPHGLFESYWDNSYYLKAKYGLRESLEYKDGKRHGKLLRYNFEGEAYEISSYENDELISQDCVFGRQDNKDFCNLNNQ